MTVKLKFDTTNTDDVVDETIIFNVFNIEESNGELIVKQLNKNFIYSVGKFDTDILTGVEICFTR